MSSTAKNWVGDAKRINAQHRDTKLGMALVSAAA
jgi:hypothetical protein